MICRRSFSVSASSTADRWPGIQAPDLRCGRCSTRLASTCAWLVAAHGVESAMTSHLRAVARATRRLRRPAHHPEPMPAPRLRGAAAAPARMVSLGARIAAVQRKQRRRTDGGSGRRGCRPRHRPVAERSARPFTSDDRLLSNLLMRTCGERGNEDGPRAAVSNSNAESAVGCCAAVARQGRSHPPKSGGVSSARRRRSAARSSSSSRSRSFRVSAAARSNSARASAWRPSLASRSPRTLGSQW